MQAIFGFLIPSAVLAILIGWVVGEAIAVTQKGSR